MNIAITSGCPWAPWFLMKSRGCNWRNRPYKLMHVVNFGEVRMSALRNGKG